VSKRSSSDYDLAQTSSPDFWYPICPHCGAKTPAEPDAREVYCLSCDKPFRVVPLFFPTDLPEG